MKRLTSLKITNFRSFSKEQYLSLKTITAIYGPNAGGKSNTARALSFMKWFVFNSSRAEIVNIPFEPFLLKKENKQPTLLEIEFIDNERSFRYGFSFNSDEIISEYLIELTSQKEKTVFKRSYQDISNVTTSKKFGFSETLINKTRKDTLLITKAREDNNEYANIIFDFLLGLNVITCSTDGLRQISVELIQKNPEMKTKVLSFLRSADFWIRDIRIDEIDTPDDVIKILPFSDEIKNNLHLQKTISIMTTHSVRDTDGTVVGATQFSLDGQESAGTRVIFDLSALIINTIEQDNVLYIDEFGLHLHPDICRYVIKQFKNAERSQLIFNTHDSSLMSALSRDEIVFVDKNQNEESVIVPLKAFSPRTNDPIEKHYRSGLYGARPFIGEEA